MESRYYAAGRDVKDRELLFRDALGSVFHPPVVQCGSEDAARHLATALNRSAVEEAANAELPLSRMLEHQQP